MVKQDKNKSVCGTMLHQELHRAFAKETLQCIHRHVSHLKEMVVKEK